jgi:hypothetical protein
MNFPSDETLSLFPKFVMEANIFSGISTGVALSEIFSATLSLLNLLEVV